MIHAFGTFAFDDSTLELTREGRRVGLEPQPARALARLLASAGELVTRDELRAAIWGADTHVDYDRGLAYCIGQVRTALGDSGDNPRFVQTLPKRGFRFVAPVAPVASTGSFPPGALAVRAPSVTPAPPGAGVGALAMSLPPVSSSGQGDDAPPGSAARAVPAAVGQGALGRPRPRLAAFAALMLVAAGGAWWWTASRPAPVTVAISIFDNETGDPAYDGFVHGLSDVVVTHLTAVTQGRAGIIGNAAVLRQPRAIRNVATIAAALDASYLIVSQLQRQGDDLRVIVHFIRLADGVHLSAERFVRPPEELARFEADVLGEAERAVRTVVPPSPGS